MMNRPDPESGGSPSGTPGARVGGVNPAGGPEGGVTPHGTPNGALRNRRGAQVNPGGPDSAGLPPRM
jgi:hypothetical protein